MSTEISVKRDHVVTLIPCAAFTLDRVGNYVVKTTTVVLDLNLMLTS